MAQRPEQCDDSAMAWWRDKSRRRPPRRPLRQYWARTPSPTEAVTGYAPTLGLVDDRKPGEVFPDEIDPAWADEGPGSGPGDDDGQVA